MPRTPENDRRSSTPRNPSRPFGDSVVDRRVGLDRRNLPRPGAGGGVASEKPADIDRRRSAGRRLSDFAKSAEEGEMNREQFLFLTAIDAFKRANGKTFPTWTEVLEVIRLLGYRKTMPSELDLGQKAEDWREQHDAPANVRTRSSKAA